MRLIDADELWMSVIRKYDSVISLSELLDEMEWTPSVVRCKDCKYCDGGVDEDGKLFLKCLFGRSYGGTNADDYCSWAERKEE